MIRFNEVIQVMNTKTLDISDLPAHLEEMVESITAGGEVLIEKDEKPFARITPVPQHPQERVPGFARGKIHIGQDFDAPLPDDFWLGTG
ncbi:MAG: type II toxin-antitoxin system prevent-host-death family antitoxin [Candidatus Sumerlaeia bacterium]|nr:type II toxin-antitoxin system prevent-host-death family antitoxin [Candidatus Sumerlaeia bacterium]